MLGNAYLFLPAKYIYQLTCYGKRSIQEGIPSYPENHPQRLWEGKQ